MPNSSDSPSCEVNNCIVSLGHISMQFCETCERSVHHRNSSVPIGSGSLLPVKMRGSFRGLSEPPRKETPPAVKADSRGSDLKVCRVHPSREFHRHKKQCRKPFHCHFPALPYCHNSSNKVFFYRTFSHLFSQQPPDTRHRISVRQSCDSGGR